MFDGTEKELIFAIDTDYDENLMENLVFTFWFLTQEDKDNWSYLEEDEIPEYWWDEK